MKILRSEELKRILDRFDEWQRAEMDKGGYFDKAVNYFYPDEHIEKIRSIYAEACAADTSYDRWLSEPLLRRFCAVLNDKRIDRTSRAGICIFGPLACYIIREMSALSEFDMEELSFVLRNEKCAAGLVTCLRAFDRSVHKQALRAEFAKVFEKMKWHLVQYETFFVHAMIRFAPDDPDDINQLHALPAHLRVIAHSKKELAVEDLHFLIANLEHGHIYAHAIAQLYDSLLLQRFPALCDDLVQRMRQRPHRAGSLVTVALKLVSHQSGGMTPTLDEIDHLDDERL